MAQIKSVYNLQEKSRNRTGKSMPALAQDKQFSSVTSRSTVSQNSCGCFLGNLFQSNSGVPKMQTVEKGHLEEVKFRLLDWDD